MLGGLPVHIDPRVLVDYRTSDDAGVYLFDEQRALVQTVDFLTPIVDDAFVYGQIAAANALSDVYAMGGTPLTALAIACFPSDADPTVIRDVFAGGIEKLREAGVALLGGHTVQDGEIKFGYAVTGEVNPAHIWTNAAARPGDILVLTKPLGTGIVTTALKFDRASADAARAVVESMLTLNRAASDTLRALSEDVVHACTDVTGFGLVGHASEMAAASECTLEIEAERVPVIDGVGPLINDNLPGGGRSNIRHFHVGIRWDAPIGLELVKLLHDPQTSGGLLVAVAERQADFTISALRRAGVPAVQIGRVTTSSGARLAIR